MNKIYYYPCSYVTFIFILSAHLFCESATTLAVSDVLENCRSVYNVLVELQYEEWPFRLNCTEVAQGKVTKDWLRSSSKYEWKYKNFTVKKLNGSGNCTFDVRYDIIQNVNVADVEVNRLSNLPLLCQPTENMINEAIFPPHDSISIWRRSLRDNKNATSLHTDRICEKLDLSELLMAPKIERSYKIESADFLIPGVYSCEVEYNGTKAFIVHYSVCVKNIILNTDPPTVNCHNKRRSFVGGESLFLECEVLSSNGPITSNDIEVHWKRRTNDSRTEKLCSLVNTTDDQVSEKTPNKITCGLLNFNNNSLKCFSYRPKNEEILEQADRNHFRISLLIINAQRADVGTYLVKLRYKDLWSKEEFIFLKFDETNEWMKIVTILLGALVTLVVLVFSAAFVWFHRIKFLLFMRRHFGAYDKEQREFVAYLSYYISADLIERDLQATKTIVTWMKELMKEKNYSVYDSYEIYEPGYSPEIVLTHLNKCHRVVLVLTESYIKDHNSKFLAHQACKNMLENRAKLISILTPGFKKALKLGVNHKEQFICEINEAITASRRITWTEKMTKTGFKDQLRYALPNLNRTKATF